MSDVLSRRANLQESEEPRNLSGPLNFWAECNLLIRFPILRYGAAPDDQELSEQYDAYEYFTESLIVEHHAWYTVSPK